MVSIISNKLGDKSFLGGLPDFDLNLTGNIYIIKIIDRLENKTNCGVGVVQFFIEIYQIGMCPTTIYFIMFIIFI